MKRIVIGRANDSDIVIPDEHDNVSRHHAVISFNFFGKMTLSDTSSNGTLINGNRMLKGASVPVTRNDEIQLGGAWSFDWNLVEDPYQFQRRVVYVIAALLFAVAVGFGSWAAYRSYSKGEEKGVVIPFVGGMATDEQWNSDSTNSVAPTEMKILTPTTNNSIKKSVRSRKKTPAKKVNNNSRYVEKPTEEDNVDIRSKKDFSSEKEMPVVN